MEQNFLPNPQGNSGQTANMVNQETAALASGNQSSQQQMTQSQPQGNTVTKTGEEWRQTFLQEQRQQMEELRNELKAMRGAPTPPTPGKYGQGFQMASKAAKGFSPAPKKPFAKPAASGGMRTVTTGWLQTDHVFPSRMEEGGWGRCLECGVACATWGHCEQGHEPDTVPDANSEVTAEMKLAAAQSVTGWVKTNHKYQREKPSNVMQTTICDGCGADYYLMSKCRGPPKQPEPQGEAAQSMTVYPDEL